MDCIFRDKGSVARAVSMLMLAACLGLSAHAAEFKTPLAITGATVVPEPGRELTGVTVLIEEGRIVAVGRKVSIPAHATRLDATGLWLYAGFINGASHLGIAATSPSTEALARLRDDEKDLRQGPPTSMQRANRNGVWPNLSIRDLYVADGKKQSAYRKQGFATALILPHPAIFGGSGDVVQLSGHPLRSATLAPAVAYVSAYRGGSGQRGYPVSKMGAVALMRQTYLDAAWYRKRAQLTKAHPGQVARAPYDPVLEAMLTVMEGGQSMFFVADSASEILHALDLAKEFEQRLVVLGGKEAWKVAGRLAKEKVPVVVSLDWKKQPALTPAGAAAKEKKSEDKKPEDEKPEDKATASGATRSWTPKWEDDFFEPLAVRRERIRLWEERVDNTRRLLEAGVTVAFTDRDLKGPNEVWARIRDAAKRGLTAEQTLACLTTGPAKILGVDHVLGTIAVGKTANLALMSAPIGDKKAKVRTMIVDGEVFDIDGRLLPRGDEETEDGEDGKEGTEEDGEEEDTEEEESKEPEDPYSWTAETDADREPALETGGKVLLKGATVLTGTGVTLENTDVLVSGGKIIKIGVKLRAPRGAKVIDLEGLWLMPGIVDPHSHMALWSINESSESITAEVRMADVVEHEQLQIHRALAGGVTTIHAMHGSANTIGGQNVVLKLKYRTSPQEMLVRGGPGIVKFALGENVTRANSSQRGRRFPNSRMGVQSVLRQAFSDAGEYDRAWERYKRGAVRGVVAAPPRKDLRLEALSAILAGDIWIHSHGYRGDELLGLLTVAEDYGVRVACLQHVLEGYRILPEMYRHGVSGSTFADLWSYKVEAKDAIPHNAAMMLRAGIVSSINSDSADRIRYMNLEAAKSMRFGGLSADEALRLITLNPAIQLGLEGRIGSIETGKDADLAVFTRHPLDAFSKCVLTLIEGEVFFQHPEFASAAPPASTFVPTPPRGLLDIPANARGRYAITGGTVHPVSSAPIAGGTVLIENGEIQYAGPSVAVPEGATVVDASGLHVYPGLINAATNLGLEEISSIAGTRDSSDIAQFQPGNRAIAAVNPHSAHLEIARCEGITTAGTWPSGGYISGRGGLIQLSGWTLPEMLRESELGLVVDLPSLPGILDQDKRKEQLEGHRDTLARIEKYVEKAQRYAEAPNAVKDLALEAMLPYVRGEKPVLFEADTYKEILEALRFAETYALDPIILGGRDAWKCAEQLAEKKVPVILGAVFAQVGRYERFDAAFACAGKLERAGVPFCIAATGAAMAKLLPTHAGIAVAHGLSPDGAVRSITLGAAEILGVADTIGSLETGKIADVILTTGHPCQTNTRTVASFIGGAPVPLTSLHQRNYENFDMRPAPELPSAPVLRGAAPMREN